VARYTDGDVDPTVGLALQRLGYDRDFAVLPPDGGPLRPVEPAPGYRRVRLDGRELTVPAGVQLDLGATAKAFAADRCAEQVARRLGVGVLVGLGGDIATAGTAPDGGWSVLVRDRATDPECVVALPGDGAAEPVVPGPLLGYAQRAVRTCPRLALQLFATRE
jgi:thiamine biosynthesis lipoprotein